MRATAIGVVIEAGPGSSFKPGDRVLGALGLYSAIGTVNNADRW